MGPSNHGAPSVLRDALQKIRLLDPADFITSERKPFPADTFTEEIIVFRSHKDSKKNIKEDQPSFVETFKRFFTGEGSIHDVLSYDFVIRYSTSERPIKIVSARSVLMIRDGKDNLVLIQSFVDENDHPIYGSDGNMIGRSLNFKKLDQSLAELFDGKNLVVID